MEIFGNEIERLRALLVHAAFTVQADSFADRIAGKKVARSRVTVVLSDLSVNLTVSYKTWLQAGRRKKRTVAVRTCKKSDFLHVDSIVKVRLLRGFFLII